MPGKKGGKKGGKGKKKKGPTYYTAQEDTLPFGFRVTDIVRTPLGMTGTVIGVKYADPDKKQQGRLWVRYGSGHEAPLEPMLIQGSMANLGYQRCSDVDHIRRDVYELQQKMKQMEEERRIAEENAKRAALGLPPLQPKSDAKGKGKKGGGKKGGKKGKKK